MHRFSEPEKRQIVNEFLRGIRKQKSIYHEYSISRTTLYKWLQQVRSSGSLARKYKRGKDHYKSIKKYEDERLLELVSQNPSASAASLLNVAKKNQIKVGYHAVENFLKRHGLNRLEKRRGFSKNQPTDFDPLSRGELKTFDRYSYIREIVEGKRTVASISRQTGISRTTLYSWINRYRAARESKACLKNNYREGSRHYRQLPTTVINKVLEAVASSPESSVGQLAQLLKTQEVPIGYHGVQNIFERYNLRHKSDRYFYSQQYPPITAVKPTQVIDTVSLPALDQLSPQVLPGPPPPAAAVISAKTTLPAPPSPKPPSFLSRVLLIAATALFGCVGLLSLISTFTSVRSVAEFIGYLFAFFALTLGTFFFLYSLKYYLTIALVLIFSRQIPQGDKGDGGNQGETADQGRSFTKGLRSGLLPDLSRVILERHPFVSIHLPLYNEKRVVNRLLEAVTTMNYDQYEVVVIDDSTDETQNIVKDWQNHPKVKLIHRQNREGFKGGALRESLLLMDPRTELVLVFDADFLPYADTIEQFLKYFQVTYGSLDPAVYQKHNVAALQGYQWHVLNKSENWITRAVRSEYAGSYVIERSGAEIYQGLKQIAGSVFMIRADVLKHYGWGTSITEDFQLTLKLYNDGFKVLYTPYIQTPSECVSTLKRLIRQRMRWAEGHSQNIKLLFKDIIKSQKISRAERLEFLYLAPYYLQSFLFLLGTFTWFLSEAVFKVRLPFWTQVWGWSLVLTNMLSLPLMNTVGLFLEESEEKDYAGIPAFLLLSYILAPFQAYASVKGFLEKEEGPWFRTPKTGKITDIYKRGRFYRWLTGIFGQPNQAPSLTRSHLAKLNLTNSTFRSELEFNVSRSPKRRRHKWLGNAIIALVLILAIVINHTARFVEQVKATSPQIYTIEQQKSQKTQPDPPAASAEPMGKPTVFTYDTQKGRLEQIFHREPRVRIKYGGWEFETVTVGSSGLGSVHHNQPYSENGVITYPDIFEGVDLRYTPSTSGFSEDYILKENKSVEEIDSLVRMVGVTPIEEKGTINFVDDDSKETIFTLPPPFMYESNSAISFKDIQNSDIKFSLGLEYKMHKTPLGWQLTKRLTEEGKKWLVDPERQFPIVIDPSVIVSTGIVDADVQFGGLQRKVAFVNGDWYAFHNDGGKPFYRKSSDGVSWGSDVNVDATENDTDNFNPSIWVKGSFIWVAWIDDSSEDIEFRSIDTTADADTLGTKCTSNLGAITIGSTNIVSIAVQNTGTDIYVAQSDTGADTEVHILQATSGCTFTDRTTGSGLTAGDRPVVVYDGDSTLRDDVMVIFQDGNLSYSHWSATTNVWVASNITLDSANTDTTYSAISDGSTTWVLSQTSTTDTKFYRLGAFEKNVDTDVGGNRTMVDIDCPASGDCKIVYVDLPGTARDNSFIFVDCNNTSCSAPVFTTVDNDVSVGPEFSNPVGIDCLTATDCKIVFYDHDADDVTFFDCDSADCVTRSVQEDFILAAGRGMPDYVDLYCVATDDCKATYIDTNTAAQDLHFVDCGDTTCDTVNAGYVDTNLDATLGIDGGISSIYCPTSGDCKVVYYDASTTNGSIFFVDCADSQCTAATATFTEVDSNVGKSDIPFLSLDCAAGATECRFVYYDGTDQDVTFIDCNASATCAGSAATDIDTDVAAVGSPVAIDCNNNAGSPDDCKIFYYDGTDQDITFVDCPNDTCSSASSVDIDSDVGSDSAYVEMDCNVGGSDAPSDCQLIYMDGVDKDIALVDCEDGDCGTPTSTTDVDTSVEADQPFISIFCPSVTNCKIVYHDISEKDVTFADCNDATCSVPTLTDIDTNVSRAGASSSISCPSSTNCKIVYHDPGAEAVFFVDCNDETCSAPDATSTLDSTVGRNAARSSIFCPSADSANCKVVYHDTASSDMTFLDCNDDACSAPTVRDLDTSVNDVLDSSDIDCPTTTNCKVIYFDDESLDDDITFIDCSTEACCVNAGCTGGGETATVLDVDTDVGTKAIDAQVNVDCVAGAGDCRVAFHDDVDNDITFIDCSAEACCVNAGCTGGGETAVVTDIDTSIGAAEHFIIGTTLDCVSGGAANCKLAYWDRVDATFYFVDCDTNDCATRTTYPLSSTVAVGGGGEVAMDCGTDAADCKIVYSDINTGTRVVFVDCLGESCVTADLDDPFTGETNVLSVSLTYDSTNDDLYAHIIKDATEQAYFKSTDASTISWSAQASYGFTTGDLNHISAPMSGAGSTQIGVTLRQTANYEFAAVPESWWTIVVGGIVASGWLGRQKLRYRRRG